MDSAKKAHVRRQADAARAALTGEQRVRAAMAFVRRLGRAHFFHAATRIALYHAVGAEMRVDGLKYRAWAANKRVFLPVLLSSSRLAFAPFEPDMATRPNRFGIPEPVCRDRDLVAAADLDLVVAPLVAFSSRGRRIGMGGGFYDRALHRQRRAPNWRHPKVVGAAFECQRFEDLPNDPWDVPLWRVCTESRIYTCA